METQPATSQATGRAVRKVTWAEVAVRSSALSREHVYFGIPRGGMFVAGLMETRGYHTTDCPDKATAFVDDIIDSGATKAKWHDRFPSKPFFSLFERGDKWLQFPWEVSFEADALDVVRRTLQLIGEDPSREGLHETPARVVRSWQEIFGGYQLDPATVLCADFEADGYDEMIVCRNIQFYSTCEHHLQPFFGKAHVGYLPDKRVVGLSKLARLVDVFARRLQIQERFTEQIAGALTQHVQPRGVGVVVEAQHFCMICRGVRKEQSSMLTSSLKGVLREAAARQEFFTLIHHT